MRNPGHFVEHLQACISICFADCLTILELGCGLGDKLAFCGRHKHLYGIDAHLPYITRARNRFGNSIVFHKRGMLSYCIECKNDRVMYDGIMMIDTIEHLNKEEGQQIIKLMKMIARQRIAIYTPLGFQPQDETKLAKSFVGELGGRQFQEHKSGWIPTDFEAEGFDVAVWKDKHDGKGSIFAIWNQP